MGTSVLCRIMRAFETWEWTVRVLDRRVRRLWAGGIVSLWKEKGRWNGVYHLIFLFAKRAR